VTNLIFIPTGNSVVFGENTLLILSQWFFGAELSMSMWIALVHGDRRVACTSKPSLIIRYQRATLMPVAVKITRHSCTLGLKKGATLNKLFAQLMAVAKATSPAL